nr:lysylphosphatidylglycerol synthase domain-containing protein [Armatimonadota bacterium]
MTFLKSPRVRTWLGYLVGLLIIGFLFLALRKDWKALRGASTLLRPDTLLISVLAGLAASILSAWSWYRALLALGAHCTFRQASRVWYTSMAARYVPGTLPGVALRIYLAERIGLTRPIAATATALDWVC